MALFKTGGWHCRGLSWGMVAGEKLSGFATQAEQNKRVMNAGWMALVKKGGWHGRCAGAVVVELLGGCYLDVGWVEVDGVSEVGE